MLKPMCCVRCTYDQRLPDVSDKAFFRFRTDIAVAAAAARTGCRLHYGARIKSTKYLQLQSDFCTIFAQISRNVQTVNFKIPGFL